MSQHTHAHTPSTAGASVAADRAHLLLSQASFGDYAVLLLWLFGCASYFTSGTLWNKPDPYRHKWFERPQERHGGTSRAAETTNIAEKLEETKSDVVVFWGSQSGTAEGLAHRLGTEIHRRFKRTAVVADLSDYSHDTIGLIPTTKLAVFIMSTYGEGDPSDNAAGFWDWTKTASSSLAHLQYAAFGLGNSNYKYYNKVIDVVVEKLNAGGARPCVPVGRADDANDGTEEDFLEWKEMLFAVCRDRFGFEEHEMEYEPGLKVVEDTSLDVVDLHTGEPMLPATARRAGQESGALASLPVKEIRSIASASPSSGRDCLHVELDLSRHAHIKYKTGDHLAVWPTNSADEVDRLLRVLELQDRKDVPLLVSSIDATSPKLRVPSPSTRDMLFRHYVEIRAPVSRETVRALVQFAPGESSRKFLMSLAEDKATYAAFLARHHVSFGRLLEHAVRQDPAASWRALPLSFVLESLRPMSPRYYSISSSSTVSPRQASITVAVAHAPLALEPAVTIAGTATSYLSSLRRPDANSLPARSAPSGPTTAPDALRLHARIRRSTFKLPTNSAGPVVLVAAGTGIAPFRAFLHERARLATMGREVGQTLLFFGCRHADEDYLYRAEIEQLRHTALQGKLTVVTAFSRMTSQGRPKTYVQDRIAEHGGRLARVLVDDDATIYFCGSTLMAKEAGERVVQAVRAHSGLDEAGGTAWREDRRRVRRWQEDVWG